MPCFKDPEGRKAWLEEKRRPKPTLEDGLLLLHAHLAPAFIAVASRAMRDLGSDGIYGFIIDFGQFEVGESCSVLTEKGILANWERYYMDRYGPYNADSEMGRSLRWQLAEAPHLEYSHSTGLMAQVSQIFRDLWRYKEEPEVMNRIVRRAFWAAIELRQSGVLPESVIITLMNDSMGNAEKVAIAAYLNGEGPLQRFAAEVGPYDEQQFERMQAHYASLLASTE